MNGKKRKNDGKKWDRILAVLIAAVLASSWIPSGAVRAARDSASAAINTSAEQPAEPAFLQSFEGEDYQIAVSCDAAAGLPEDAVLSADEYGRKSELFVQRCEEMGHLYGWEQDRSDSVRLFSIGFYSGTEEIEPAAEVKVSIRLPGSGEDGGYLVTHFGAGAEEAEDVKAECSYEDGYWDIDFLLDSFSDVAVCPAGTDESNVMPLLDPVGDYVLVNKAYGVELLPEAASGTTLRGAKYSNIFGDDKGPYTILVSSEEDREQHVFWSFIPAGEEEDRYYIKTEAGGSEKYLSIEGAENGAAVTVGDDPSVIIVTEGTKEREGLVRLTNEAGQAVNLYGGQEGGQNFGGWSDSSANEWFALCDVKVVPLDEVETVKDAVSPPSSVINLFDYWVEDRESPDCTEPGIPEGGINDGHTLKFSYNAIMGGGDAEKDGAYNVWTGSSRPFQGIVKNLLEDGCPVLNVGESGESLKYLFDPTAECAYRKTFRGVKGLLQMDEDGFYYYNSKQNFAELNEETREFSLYERGGILAGGSSPNGQFFPFNQFREDALKNSVNQDINHYFGMTLTARFVQQYGGHTASSRTTPMTFEFSGDDDVWIFVDDVLAADLGGLHDAASVRIDFSTGEIRINDEDSQSTTLKEVFENAGRYRAEDWNGEIFANNTYHTLKFFYLERGNTDSNLFLEYNLNEVPPTSVYKVDQYGEAVPGAVFAVYRADEDYRYLDDEGNAVSLSENSIQIDPETGEIALDDGRTIHAQYIRATDENGEMVFLDPDDSPYSLGDLERMFGRNFILREIDVPEGYRIVSDEVHLYITGGNKSVLLCANTYDSGVWSAPSALITAPTELYRYRDNEKIEYYTPGTGAEIESEGTLFAVVYKYVGGEDAEFRDSSSWAPVYGSDAAGYTVVDAEEYESPADAAVYAAKQAEKYGQVIFAPGQSGSMQLVMDNLPGDVKTYYYMADSSEKENARYSICYYWTQAESLDEANGDNTVLIDPNVETEKGIGSDFERVFGASIRVPNLINRLFVQKRDENGNLIDGAHFALYDVTEKDGDIFYVDETGSVPVRLSEDTDGDNAGEASTDGQEGSYQVGADGTIQVTMKDGTEYTIRPVQTAETLSRDDENNTAGEDGTGSFANLLSGTYYMREIGAPAGYELNTSEVMVLVTDDAIYANAGAIGDGINVARGPGYVVSTLEQFATAGDIDRTLTWIYSMLKINTEDINTFHIGDYGQWEFAVDSGGTLTGDKTEAMRTYLKYDAGNSASGGSALFNYLVNTTKAEDGAKGDSREGTGTRRLYTNVGWSYLEIYQDSYYQDSPLTEGVEYTLLRADGENYDISSLFSRSVYVQVIDEKRKGDVTLKAKKQLIGRELKEGEFSFLLTENGEEAARAVNAADGTIEFHLSYEAGSGEGRHSYELSEIKGTDKEITYDGTVYTVEVSVTDEGGGKLKTEVSYPDRDLIFTNTYKESGDPGKDPDPDKDPDPGREPSGGKKSGPDDPSSGSGEAALTQSVNTGDRAPIVPLCILAAVCAALILLMVRRGTGKKDRSE